MSNLNTKIKKILEDIIDVAYAGEPEENLENYKKFYFNLITKECATVSGWYKPQKRLIEVFNLSRGSGLIVKTCIHELAHHIDQCKNGCSGHQKPFYDEYTTLLYAGLNMRIYTVEDVTKDSNSNDRNKVLKILDAWEPNYVDYDMSSTTTIYVSGGYEERETLKQNGYKWDSVQKKWCKDVEADGIEYEETFLNSLGLEFSSSEGLSIEAVGYIVADGNTYEAKDILKSEGFFFSKNGKKAVWKKKINVSEAKEEIVRLYKIDGLKTLTYKVQYK